MYGTWDLRPGRDDSPGVRYLKLRARLEETRAAVPDLGLVVCELPHHRGGAATQVGAGLLATAQAWAAERGVEVTGVHTGALKRWATGGGAASKETVVRCACERFACASLLDDEADALFLLAWGLDLVGGR